MTDTSVTNGTTSLQDPGTGAPSDHHDPNSAAMYGGGLTFAKDYVAEGLTFTYNSGGPSVDISAGVVMLEFSGTVNVQSSPKSSYDRTWHGSHVFPVSIPAVSGISLDASSVNEIYVWIDETADNDVNYRVGSAVSAPSNPSIKIGEINTTDDTVNEDFNRGPVVKVDEVRLTQNGDSNNPAITWDGDDDLGFYRNTDNDIRFTAGGTARFTVNTAGFFVNSGDFFLNGGRLERIGSNTDASTGDLRFGNNTSMYARNSSDDGDFGIDFSASDDIQIVNANLNLNSNDLVDGTTVVWDATGEHIEQSALENSSITINTGTNISGGDTVSLGGSITLDVTDKWVDESGDTMTGDLIVNPSGTGVQSNRPLALRASDGSGNAWFSIWSDDDSTAGILLGDPTDSWQGRIHYDNNTEDMHWYTNAVERMRLQTNGDLDIEGSLTEGATL